jgi:hypothetical protein
LRRQYCWPGSFPSSSPSTRRLAAKRVDDRILPGYRNVDRSRIQHVAATTLTFAIEVISTSPSRRVERKVRLRDEILAAASKNVCRSRLRSRDASRDR